MEKWIKTIDQLPKKKERVIGYWINGEICVTGWREGISSSGRTSDQIWVEYKMGAKRKWTEFDQDIGRPNYWISLPGGKSKITKNIPKINFNSFQNLDLD